MHKRIEILVRCLFAVVLAGVLVSCSSGERETEARNEDAAAEETVFDPMTGTMDRAREVEDLSNSRMDQLNEELEESGEPRP